MDTPDRPSLWLPPISLAACGMLALVAPAMHAIPLAVTGQAFLLLVMVHAFFFWPPMVRLVAAMPAPHRIAFFALIASVIVGHYTIQTRRFFPFVAWQIFATVSESDPVTCREFLATTASGAKFRLLVEQQFPSIVQIDGLDTLDDRTTEHLARVLAQAYNSRHAADPVRQVDLVVMAVHLHPPANESRDLPSCEFLQRYDISSGP